jgi:nicotinamidase-related amidase
MDNAALVISECQRGIVDPELSMMPALADQVAERGIIARIAGLADAFGRVATPVVYCIIAHRADGVGLVSNSLPGAMALKHQRMIVGSVDVDVPHAITPVARDIVSCRATGVTAFYGTDLDLMLRLQRVDTLVVVGVHQCGAAWACPGSGQSGLLPGDC